MKDRAVVVFEVPETGLKKEIDIPLEISANDLIVSLNSTYDLNMDTDNLSACYFVSDNPMAFLHGSRKLSDFGIRDGSRIMVTQRMKAGREGWSTDE